MAGEAWLQQSLGYPSPYACLKNPSPQHVHTDNKQETHSWALPPSPVGYANTKLNQLARTFSPLLKYDRKKKVGYSKEIDSNSSFSVFQSVGMSASLTVEGTQINLVGVEAAILQSCGQFGRRPPPPPFAPGEIRIRAISLATRNTTGRLIPQAEGFPLNSSPGSAFADCRAGGPPGQFN